MPAYVRLYELAAVLRAKRFDAARRAEEIRNLQERVDLATTSIHRNKIANDVFNRVYKPSLSPRREAK